MKKYLSLLMVLFVIGSLILSPSVALADESNGVYENSVDLYRLSENDQNGISNYLGDYVTVKGIVAVDSGVWHDNVDYFAICTEDGNYRFNGGTIVYAPKGNVSYHVGDEVIVTGKVVNNAYSADKGTTTIKVENSYDIKKISVGKELPKAFPLYTDPSYEEVEYELDYLFEGKPVRVVGKVHNLSTSGTVHSFQVDGSRDGDYDDGNGAILVKSYSYSGISFNDIQEGDWVVAEGILMQNDSSAPYNTGYYIRPCNDENIQLLGSGTELHICEATRKDDEGNAVFINKTVTVSGISAVSTGEWHDNNSAYSLVSEVSSPGYPFNTISAGIYIYDTIEKCEIASGDNVTVTGVIDNQCYDRGTVALKPISTVINGSDNKIQEPNFIYSDMGFDSLHNYESMPVKLHGKVASVRNTGITRSIVLDASEDGVYGDNQGVIDVKMYSYGSASIDNIMVGDDVVVTGVLQKSKENLPYTSGYFVRTTNDKSIVKRNADSKKTLYIHLDAFKEDYVNREDWETPTFNSLIGNGVLCTEAYGEYVSMTTANMTTLCTGSHTSTHNVPALAFYDKDNDRRVRYLQNYDVDTIGEAFQKEGLLVGVVKQRKLFMRGADLFEEGGSIDVTTNQAVDMITQQNPDLMVVLYNETDSTAHKYGINSSQQQGVVEDIDSAIGELINAYKVNGSYDDLNVVIASDHGMDTVHTNLTQDLADAFESTGIPYQNAYLNIGPFDDETKVVYNLASGSAQVYFRKVLTDEETALLITTLESIDGVNAVFERDELDIMNTPNVLGDLVVDCEEGYAFSVSKAEHGSLAQCESFMLYNGVDIKEGCIYDSRVQSVDMVANIYAFHNITPPNTVDGVITSDIFIGE